MAESMELETRRFYQRASTKVTHASTRQLLMALADEGASTRRWRVELAEKHARHRARAEEDAAERRLFLLQVVQPGLAGLMDGSVSTLAPLFAAAFATHNSWDAFRVGLAASVGAGISMGFAEALSDDGSLTGRGKPMAAREPSCGVATTIGGIGHTLPYLIPGFRTATLVAALVVAVELVVISAIRNRYMDTPFLAAAFQVIVGGVLVFLAGILIGKLLSVAAVRGRRRAREAAQNTRGRLRPARAPSSPPTRARPTPPSRAPRRRVGPKSTMWNAGLREDRRVHPVGHARFPPRRPGLGRAASAPARAIGASRRRVHRRACQRDLRRGVLAFAGLAPPPARARPRPARQLAWEACGARSRPGTPARRSRVRRRPTVAQWHGRRPHQRMDARLAAPRWS